MVNFDAPVEQRSLESYHQEARAMIGKWGTRWMLFDEDSISNVANAIARAEIDFDPTRGCKRVTLRCTYGRRQIWQELRKRVQLNKRPVHFSISTDERGSKVFDIQDKKESVVDSVIEKEIIELMTDQLRRSLDRRRTNSLTVGQKSCLRMRLFDGMSVKEIAERRKCSNQAVSELIKYGIERLEGEIVVL